MFCLLYQRKDVREDHTPPSHVTSLQLALFLFIPWVITSLKVGRAGSLPCGYPRCFFTGQAVDAESEIGMHHQGPTLEKKQGHQVGCPWQHPSSRGYSAG